MPDTYELVGSNGEVLDVIYGSKDAANYQKRLANSRKFGLPSVVSKWKVKKVKSGTKREQDLTRMFPQCRHRLEVRTRQRVGEL